MENIKDFEKHVENIKEIFLENKHVENNLTKKYCNLTKKYDQISEKVNPQNWCQIDFLPNRT